MFISQLLKGYARSTDSIHRYHNGTSEASRDSHECHFAWSSLGNVIIYGCQVRPLAMKLGHCVLMRVSKLVGVARSDFVIGLPI